jgi:CheY-like chemotaxis protein
VASGSHRGDVEQSDKPTVVLVAEDNFFIRRAVAHMLQHAGFHVMEACDGIDAR